MTTVIATTEKEEAQSGLFTSRVGPMPIYWGITQEEERCSDVEYQKTNKQQQKKPCFLYPVVQLLNHVRLFVTP